MEIEVGMYIRSKKGEIGKIFLLGDENNPYYTLEEKASYGVRYVMYKKDLLKASYNLIDLIEVDDYVNGKKVFSIKNSDGHSIYVEPITELFEKDIQTIVTKEQFESMSYKVGE